MKSVPSIRRNLYQLISCKLLTALFIFVGFYNVLGQTSHVKKVVFQGFWWDYKNNNFPDDWAGYLAELAPRLKDMGVDAIWIPPSVKNQNFGEKGVGYAPYDNYDLGDKFQKEDVSTRVGTKDELLQMVAIMHANGIEVIQDIVPNHIIGAGSDTGGGGQDPAAPGVSCTDTWKNFRYACYETPATDQSAGEYLARKGRFPKNHQNFHPNLDHGCTSGLCDPNADPICWQGFGPDVCYYDGALGLSSNATYNPSQSAYSPYGNGGTGTNNGYMRKHTREWLTWYKKQMGFDGVRIDAVKHFPNFAAEDFLYNLQNTAGWANGGDQMFAVGEWVGDAAALDAWTTAVNYRSGTFDFNLRAFHSSGGLRGMIYGNGSFDLGNLPGAQQGTRYVDISGARIHRTVPFINNHDTYRPQTDASGTITGWNTNDELSPHVEIIEPRMGAAYAILCAMDGNPQIFFEDLFNIANTGKRWTHLPTSTSDLPANQDIVNIMKAHKALDFKSGVYKVRSSESGHYNVLTGNTNDDDHIIIERSGKAIIAATDAWNTDQESWVDTDFAPGTVLVDYSGGISTISVVQGDKRANIKTRAVGYPSFTYSTTYADHGAYYHGYSIWAPQGMSLNTSNAPITTTQEWEMENDLGDSHCESLGQGGRTPDNSPNDRVFGKIFAGVSTNVSYEVTLGSTGTSLTLDFYDLAGNLLHTQAATNNFIGSFSNTSTRWITAKVRNTAGNTAGQKCFVKITYSAPAVVNTAGFPVAIAVSIWTSNGGSSDWNDCRNWEEGKIPACNGTVIIPHNVKYMPTVDACFTGSFTNNAGLTLRPKFFLQGPYNPATGLMSDALRSSSQIPAASPYGGSETIAASVLATTGSNAIVDWVKIELRDKNMPNSILHTRSALVQRDGDIVETDGISPVFFNGVASDNYYIAVRHRNHLGTMTATAVSLDNTIQQPDFSSIATWGSNAQADLGSGVMGLWVGDLNASGIIDAGDRSEAWNNRNQIGYNLSDSDLSGVIDAADRSNAWNNRNKIQQLP